MKLFHLSLLLLSALLMSSCIGDNLDDCPPLVSNNLSIGFLYPDDQGQDIFTQKVNQVDLFIFDSDGHHVSSHRIDAAALTNYAGTDLKLDPGTYRIVCWGNASSHSTFEGLSTGSLFSDAFLSNSNRLSSGISITGDSLCYAPNNHTQSFDVVVPQNGSQHVSINFKRAHINVSVYVKGFQDFDSQGNALPAEVDLLNVSSQYTFDMQATNQTMTYRNSCVPVTINGVAQTMVSFTTPLFDEQTPMEVVVREPSTGREVARINIADFLAQNNITIGNTVELDLPIQISFIQGGVEITMPGWDNNPVGPGQ